MTTGPLGIDDWAGRPLVGLSSPWQHASAWLLGHETPGHMAVAAVILALIAARLRAWRTAVSVLVGVVGEMALLQWVVKPLVDRHELAPGLSFPSTYVGAVCALASAAVLLCRPAGPIGRRLPPEGAHRLGAVVTGVLAADALAVSLATIITGGHLFSDVVAAIPLGLAFPVVTYAFVGRLGPRWRLGQV